METSGANIDKIATSLLGLSDKSLLAAASVMNLSESQVIALLNASGLSTELAKTAIAQSGYTFATGTATAATVGFGTAIKNAAVGLWTFLTTNPVGWAIAAATVIAGCVVALDALNVSFEEAAEASAEAREAYNSAASEVESLNSQLEETKSKIQELDAKGTLTLTEEAELTRLKSLNKELEYSLAIAEKEAAVKKEASENAAVSTLTNKSFKIKTGETKTVDMHYNGGSTTVDIYDSADIIDYTYQKQEELNDLLAKQNELQAEFANMSVDDDKYEYTKNRLESYGTQISDLQSEISENLTSINTEYATIAGNPVFSELTARIEDLFDFTLSDSDAAAKTESTISTLFSKVNFTGLEDKLIEAAKQGDAALEAAIENTSGLDAALQDAGVSADDLKAHIKALADDSLNIDEVTNQLRDAYTSGRENRRDTHGTAFDSFINGKTDEEIEIFYRYVNAGDFDLSQWTAEDLEWNFFIAVNGADAATANIESLSSSLTLAQTNMENLTTAMTESASASGLTADSIANVEAMFGSLESYDAAELFENTELGVRLNTDALRELNAEYEVAQKQKYADTLNDLQASYDALTEKMKACGSEQSEQFTYLLNQRNAIAANIAEVQQLAAQYDGLTSSYNEWMNAQSGPEEGDTYDGVTSNLENVKELYKEGLVGTNEFRAAVQMMTDEDVNNYSAEQLMDIYEKGYPLMTKYFKEGSDGCINFLKDVEKLGNGWATMNDDGQWSIDFDDEDVAKELGISVEAVQAIMLKLRDFGFDIEIETPTDAFEAVESGYVTATNATKEFRDIAAEAAASLNTSFNFESTDLTYLESELLRAKNILGSLQPGEAGFEEASTVVAALTFQMQSLSQPAIMSVDTSQVDGAIGDIIPQLQEYHNLLDQREVAINCGWDTSDLDAQIQEVYNAIQNQSGINREILIDLGINPDASQEEIEQQIEAIDPQVLINAGIDPNAIVGLDSGDITVTTTVVGQEDLDALQFTIQSLIDMDKTATVIAETSGSDKLTSLQNQINNMKGKTIWITPKIRLSGTGEYTGSAHISGTALVGGTALANGDWRTKRTETALVGERKPEIVVDPKTGKWHTVGDNGAEFTTIPAGSIVFNGEQTEQLLKNGHINSRGRAYASGTAYDTGFKGSGSFFSSGDIKKSSNNTKGDSASDATKKAAKAVTAAAASAEDLFDFAEVKLNRLETKTDDFIANAENATKYSSAMSNYQNAINNIDKQIEANQSAAALYLAQANKVGLSNSIKTKVQNGSIELSKYGESTQEKITEYQDWYEKMLDCQSAIGDLIQQQKELAKQKLDEIVDQYSWRIDYSTAQSDSIAARIDYMNTAGYSVSKQTNLLKSQLSLEEYNYKKVQQAATDYYSELHRQMSAGLIQKNSEAWYEAQQQLEEYNQSLYESQQAMAELNQQIQEIESNKIQYAINSITRMIEQIGSMIGLIEARGETVSESYYEDQIRLNNDSINKEYALIEQYTKEQANYEVGSEKWDELADKIHTSKQNIIDLLTENENLKDSIVSARWSEFDTLQQETEKSITEIEYLRGMLNDTFVDESGNLTDSGAANIALIAKGIELQKQSIADYTEAIAKLNEEYENGNISQNEYNERLDTYTGAIRDSASAVKDYEDVLVDLYTSQLEAQNDLLAEEIDLRIEALKKKKDYYDYDKQIRTKSKDIQSLQAQIAALSGVETAAGKAKLAQLQAELAEAQEDMDDTVRNHEYELIESGYTSLKDSSQEELDALLTSISTNADMQQEIIDEMLGTVKSSYASAYAEINRIIENTGIAVLESTQTAINQIGTIAGSTQLVDDATASVQNTPASSVANNIDTSKINTSTDNSGKSTTSAEKASTSKENASNSTMLENTSSSAVIKATAISLNKTSLSINVGATSTLTATVSPSGAAVSITWSSSNTKVATVSSGTVKGVGAGSATITAKDATSGKSATCSVTVKGTASTSSSTKKVSGVSGDLKKGSKGDDVKLLQTALNALGYRDNDGKKLAVDGDFGTHTQQAVKKFQKAMGLSTDGVVGKNTKKKFKAKGYASGTRYATGGLHWLDEKGIGTETLITPYGRIQQLEEGTRVFNDSQVDNLFLLSKITPDLITEIGKSDYSAISSDAVSSLINNSKVEQHYDCLLKVEGDITKDTFPGVKKMCEEAYSYISKEMNRDMHLSGYKRKS